MRPKLLYIYPSRSTFVIKDLKSLSLEYDVVELLFAPKAKWRLPLLWLGLFFRLLLERNYRYIVCQFGGYQSLIPALFKRFFGKKLVIVVGGFDAVSIPSIGYGGFQNKWMSRALSFSYKNADVIIPVHRSLIKSEQSYCSEVPKYQGIQHFIENLKTPFVEIPNGYDHQKWPLTNHNLRDRVCITVAGGLEEERRFILKGIDLIAEVAALLPDFKFIVIGGSKTTELNNLVYLPEVKNTELSEYYNSAMIYLQLSLSEGFPNALCEAMLCGCIPVVSAVAAMPDIVGQEGYILQSKNVLELKSILERIPNEYSVEKMEAVRNRIESLYTEEARAKKLLDTIAKV
jgi:glycosyltransferase involved in cell wall biosynthesis